MHQSAAVLQRRKRSPETAAPTETTVPDQSKAKRHRRKKITITTNARRAYEGEMLENDFEVPPLPPPIDVRSTEQHREQQQLSSQQQSHEGKTSEDDLEVPPLPPPIDVRSTEQHREQQQLPSQQQLHSQQEQQSQLQPQSPRQKQLQ